MDSIKAESSGGPAAPEMRAMTLARPNLPAILEAEIGPPAMSPYTGAQKPGVALTVCLGSNHSTTEFRPLMGKLSM